MKDKSFKLRFYAFLPGTMAKVLLSAKLGTIIEKEKKMVIGMEAADN